METETSREQIAVVTGASRGLGHAICSALADAGFKVYGVARSSKPTARIPGSTYIGGIDLTDSSSLQELRPILESANVLVNNAGVASDGVLAFEPTASTEEMIALNLGALISVTREWVRGRLRRRVSGNVINISSIVGSRGYKGLASYGATKAAVDGFTRGLAREVGGAGIRVNSVAPGFVETEMTRELDQKNRDRIAGRTPLGRLGRDYEIASAVVFLASESSSFVTGQTLYVDGGISI